MFLNLCSLSLMTTAEKYLMIELLTLGAWFNGRMKVSKTLDRGSIPRAPAIENVRQTHRLF